MKKTIFILLFLILLAGCGKSGNYEIKSLTQKNIDPLQNAYNISISNQEVRSYLQGRSFTVEAKNVDENEKASLPNVYKGLTGILYKVHYKSSDFELIVITNEKEVVSIVPLTKIKI